MNKNRIKIFDTTLRDGEQSPGCTMRANEKLEFARKLKVLNVDVIEAGFPISSQDDFYAVKSIAEEIKGVTVCGLARALKGDIDRAYEAVKPAEKARIHIFIATSELHMQYKLKMSAEEVLTKIKDSVSYARTLVDDVQFSAEDATRSDKTFLAKAFSVAIKAGATVVNIADTVGICSPENIIEYVDYIKKNVEGIDSVDLGIHCHNDLGMAVANSLSAIKHGVTQIECTVNGIGERSGNASLEEIVMALHTKSDEYAAETAINTKAIYKTSKSLAGIIGAQIPPNKPIVGANVFKHESGIHQHGVMQRPETYEILKAEDIGVVGQEVALGKHSGKHAFSQFCIELGYNLSEDELQKHFDNFKLLCDKKKFVTRLDIEAMLSNHKINLGGKYALKTFLIATKKDGAFATVTLSIGEDEMTYQAEGNGALDSSFNAINKVIGKDFHLIDYSLHAVTSGEDALGEAVVKLCDTKHTTTGRGLSTDIVEASLLAYIDAGNKLLEE